MFAVCRILEDVLVAMQCLSMARDPWFQSPSALVQQSHEFAIPAILQHDFPTLRLLLMGSSSHQIKSTVL